MADIVIIGAGLGGMPAAYETRALLGKEHRVTVVNATDTFQFTPSNPWVAVGWRQRETTTLPIAPHLAKKNIGFVGKAVTAIDAPANRLTLDGGETLGYDHLVITTGPKLGFHEVPITFVTSEPYIGHMGLGGVGDSKSMLERDLPGRHGRHRCGLRRAAADPAAQQCQLVQEGQVGAPGQDRLRKILPGQDEMRQLRAHPREVRAEGAGHRAPGRQVNPSPVLVSIHP